MALEVTAGTSMSSLGITHKNVSRQIIRPTTVNKKEGLVLLAAWHLPEAQMKQF